MFVRGRALMCVCVRGRSGLREMCVCVGGEAGGGRLPRVCLGVGLHGRVFWG